MNERETSLSELIESLKSNNPKQTVDQFVTSCERILLDMSPDGEDFFEEDFTRLLESYDIDSRMNILKKLSHLDVFFGLLAVYYGLNDEFCVELLNKRLRRFEQFGDKNLLPTFSFLLDDISVRQDIDFNIVKTLIKIDSLKNSDPSWDPSWMSGELEYLSDNVKWTEEFILEFINNYNIKFYYHSGLHLDYSQGEDEIDAKIIELLRLSAVKSRILNDPKLVALYDDNIDEEKEGWTILDWLMDNGLSQNDFWHWTPEEKKEEFEARLEGKRKESYYYRAYGIKGESNFLQPDWENFFD